MPPLVDNLVIVFEGKTDEGGDVGLCDLEPGPLVIHFSSLQAMGT